MLPKSTNVSAAPLAATGAGAAGGGGGGGNGALAPVGDGSAAGADDKYGKPLAPIYHLSYHVSNI